MTEYSPQWKEKKEPDPYGRQDLEYFQGMYPQRMKELQKYVIQQCDTMDYAGSPIYDEYPDGLMIERACRTVCLKISEELGGQETEAPDWVEDERVETYETGKSQMLAFGGSSPWGRPPGGPSPWSSPPGGPPWGPPPGSPPPWGPPPGGSPPGGPPPGDRPPGGPPPWGRPPGGPPPGGRPPGGPPPWGRPPGGPPPGSPPPWGPPPGGPPPGSHPPGDSHQGSWLSDIVKVLFLNELQRRRCRTGRC